MGDCCKQKDCIAVGTAASTATASPCALLQAYRRHRCCLLPFLFHLGNHIIASIAFALPLASQSSLLEPLPFGFGIQTAPDELLLESWPLPRLA